MSGWSRGPELDAAADPPLDVDVRDAYVAAATREALSDEPSTWEHDVHLLFSSLYVDGEGPLHTRRRAGQSAAFESAVADVERGQVVAGHLHDDEVLAIVESDAPDRERIERLGDELLEPSPTVARAIAEVGLDPGERTGEAAVDAAREYAGLLDDDGVTPGPRYVRARGSLAVSTTAHRFVTGTLDEEPTTGHPLSTAARRGTPTPSEAVEAVAADGVEPGDTVEVALAAAVGAVEAEARAVAERRRDRDRAAGRESPAVER